jgi:hypothetical protein
MEIMPSKKPTNPDLPKRFQAAELIMISMPIFLIAIAVVVALVAPHIIRSWEIDRCLEVGGNFDHEKDECVVTRKGSPNINTYQP